MTQLFSMLLGITLFTLSLNANEHYLLPEHQSDLMHTLKRKIARAENITIITSGLMNPSLAKSIEKGLTNGAVFHLITTDLATAAYYAKYKNTTVKVPASDRVAENFQLNIFSINGSDVCFSTLSFNTEDLTKQIGEVICTTAQEEIIFAEEIEKRFNERFEDYHR